ncbi:iron complex transport system ATP-binding protein [Cytobacillus oceanisediminis]|jgi:iron complex transport system ATP-binding protein|uniref:Iron complex transport system ATP-binding protein n=1 Tax=Cytobacillus oceanisediminis TaxID=665099 RepID=A0A2V3A9Q4_9BACI|nr:ABC transporter ATP-binding protein [Cytobacillus oceanisediminis]PWW31974.1 iron complex transport system ATP-binding protein [Cytobacillus oceanisediminis]
MSQIDSRSVICLNSISWKRNGKEILHNVSWEVEKGQHWAVLGLNGSGKTTLLKMITGYEWPNGGQVSVLGNLYGKTNIPELRRSIGWVSTSLDDKFQFRPSDTALEIILSGKFASIGLYEDITQKDLDKAIELMERFNIRHVENQTLTCLSQGEKRKAMIARALMASPKLLILDEPCNGLDIYSKEELLSSIEKMMAQPDGPTVLYVTHHIEEIVPSISHALLLKEGKVMAQGSKRTTVTEPLLAETFKIPVSLDWENGRPWIRVKSLQETMKAVN